MRNRALHRTGGRIVATISSVLMMAQLVGCSIQTIREVPIASEIADPKSKIHSDEGQRITGYTTADSIYHDFSGRVRLLGPDAVAFVRVDPDFQFWNSNGRLIPDRTLTPDEVARISVSETNPAGVALATAGGVGLIVAVLVVLGLSRWSLFGG